MGAGFAMRKSTLYITSMLICSAVLICLLSIHPMLSAKQQKKAMEKKKELVRILQLTDLSLFTEARYTRHISQADLSSAFQDHPISFEHFPSGSLTQPPAMSQRRK